MWNEVGCNSNMITNILMYVPHILYRLLSRPTNSQCIYIYIYIHINNILCIVSTATYFNAPTLSSVYVYILMYGFYWLCKLKEFYNFSRVEG